MGLEERVVLYESNIEADFAAKISNYSGRIIVIPPIPDIVSKPAFNWLDTVSKIAAVIIIPYGKFDSAIGMPEYNLANTALAKDQRCVFFTISTNSLNRLIAALGNSSGLMRIDGSDGISPARQTFTSGWFFFITVLMAVTNIAVGCVAVVRLLAFFKVHRWQPSITNVCLWLELLGALLRFWYWGFDPFGSRRIIPDPIKQSSMKTVNFPFTISYVLRFGYPLASPGNPNLNCRFWLILGRRFCFRFIGTRPWRRLRSKSV